MKRTVLSILVAFISCSVLAQEYTVTSVTGNVRVATKQGVRKLELREKLRPASVIDMPFEGVLELVDMAAGKRYVLQSPGRNSVEQLIKSRKSTVMQLSRQFINYFAKQVSGGGEVITRQVSDPAIVTRSIYGDSLVMAISRQEDRDPPKNKPNTLEEDLDEWMKRANSDFDDFFDDANKEFERFREQANREFEEFMRQAWDDFNALDPIPLPDDDEMPLIVNAEPDMPPKHSTQLLVEKLDRMPEPDVLASPLGEFRRDRNFEYEQVAVEFYGLHLSVSFNDSQRFLLRRCSNGACADAWRRLAKRDYDALVEDCIRIRQENNLSDWAYLQLLDHVSQACMGGACNEATLLMAYLFGQSGFQMRLAIKGDRLYMLYSCTSRIYTKAFYLIHGTLYYPYNCDEYQLRICSNAKYKNERALSLWIPQQQHFGYRPSKPRKLVSTRNPDFEVEVQVNQNLMDFYETYPTSFADNNFMTRWAMYANTPMDKHLCDMLYPRLRMLLKGLDRQAQLQQLLFFMQTAFAYKDDDLVWGDDRAFFPEESFFYPYNDCEDRAILLSRLVRDLLHLPVMLVYYPGHLATAIRLDNRMEGSYFVYDGNRFMVCDPTYVPSWIGQAMPEMDSKSAKVIVLQ